jgi:Amt family ammonium transporter
MEQLKAMGLTSYGCCRNRGHRVYLKMTVGLRPTDEVERQGLDLNEHGEEGYIY